MGEDERPEIRISDADRDATVARLSGAMAEGRLDVTEFEQRSRRAYAATLPSELEPLVADLPIDTLPIPAATHAVAVPNAASAPAASGTRRLLSIFGDIRRSGEWEPGERTRCFALFGDTRLDVSDVERADVDIVAWSVFGDVRVTVARGARIDANALAIFGDFRDAEAPSGERRGTVRVRSYSIFGDLRLFRA